MEKILLVDDEANILEAYQRQFRKQFQVHTALGGEQGLKTLRAQGPFAVVVSDFRMPGMDGNQFLSCVRQFHQDTVRMMLTGNADLDMAMEAVNQGAIFRFLTKPCPPETLFNALEAGVKQYRLIRAEKELLEQTLTGSLQALANVLSLVHPEAFGRASRLKRYVTGLAHHMGLSNVWGLEIAATLSQIGCVILPETLLKKVNAGEPLDPQEERLFTTHPSTGAEILGNIPRMKEVADIIAYQHKHFDGSGSPHDSRQGEDIPVGARLLKVTLDFDTLLMQNFPRSQAFGEMENRRGWYDPAVLQALKIAFVPEQKFKLATLSLRELRPHLVLAEGIFDEQGILLAAKGQELTEWMVARLKLIGGSRPVKEPIHVIVPEDSSPGKSPRANTA
ncbi:MAG: response regulator [Nitrospinae bacterium]|nr:response regulator [Nitrospinota bacterium]